MKFIVLQSNGEHDKNRHFRECFSVQRSLIKAGHDCDVTGKNHPSLDLNNYDVILNVENYGDGWIPNLSSNKQYKILWEIDAHFRGIDYFNHLYKDSNYNLMLHSTKEFVNISRGDIWFPNAYDNTLINKLDVPKTTFVGFCGNEGTEERKQYLNLLKTKWNAKVDVFVIGQDMVNAINSYHIHFNKNIGIDINYRTFETLGCGTLLLTNYNKHCEELGFKNFQNCVFYTDQTTLNTNLSMLHKNPDKIAKIASAGYELAKSHTYDVRINQLLNELKTRI